MKKYLALILSLAILSSVLTVPFATVSAIEVTPENVYYYTDFDLERSELLSDGWKTYGADPGNSAIDVKKLTTGENVLMLKSTTETLGYTRFSTPQVKVAADASKKPLVFEYRVKIPYLQGGTSRLIEGNDASNTSAAVTIGGAGYSNGVRFLKDDVLVADLKDRKVWHTIAIVYNADAATRTAYVDGVKCGTSTDTYTTGYENNWFNNNIFWHTFNLYGQYNAETGNASEAHFDYVRIYEYASEFDVSIKNSDKTGTGSIVVDFTSMPLTSTLVPENFIVNGKAVSEIIPAGNNGLSYELVLDETLALETDYTLTVKNLKSTVLEKNIGEKILFFRTKPSFKDENIFVWYPFDSADEISTWTNKTANKVGITTSDGKSVLKLLSNATETTAADGTVSVKAGTTTATMATFRNPNGTATGVDRTNLPELVYEIRYRMKATGNAYLYGRESYSQETSTFIAGGTKKRNELRLKTSDTVKATYDETDWNTVTVHYKNESVGDNSDYSTRKLYLNGEYVNESAAIARSNGWWQYGQFQTTFAFANVPSVDDYVEIDFIKLYEPAEVFAAEIEENTQVPTTKLTLDFNQSVAGLTKDQLSINGVNPSSVTLLDEKTQRYEVIFGKELEYETAYKLKLEGVKDLLGNSINETLDFTTVLAQRYEVGVFHDGNGTVTIKGETVENESIIEAKHNEILEVTLTPNPGYIVSSALANGEEMTKVSDNVYSCKITDVTYLEFAFEVSNFEPAVVSASSVFAGTEGKADEYTAYSFATLKNSNAEYTFKECGTVISTTVTAPTVGGENCRVFKTLVPLTKTGHFGVGIKDNGYSVLGSDYYMRPYAIYEKDGESFIFYGEALTVNFQAN